MTLRAHSTELPGVLVLESPVHRDARGWFSELWSHRACREAGIDRHWVQQNAVHSVGPVIRGIHWQLPPAAQAKLVRPLMGAIRDVAVDLRRSSPTFGHWVAVELEAGDGCALLVPEGFGHGYRVLSSEALVSYALSAEYAPEHERALAWNDPGLAIDWGGGVPILSDKDARAPYLDAASVFD